MRKPLFAPAAKRLGWLVGGYAVWMLSVPNALWNNLYGVIGAFALMGLYLYGFWQKVFPPPTANHICKVFLLYTLWQTMLWLFSLSPSRSLRTWLFYLGGFCLTAVTAGAIRHWQDITRTCTFGAAALAIGGLCALYQQIGGAPVRAGQTDAATTGGVLGRVESFYGNANTYSHIVLLLFPLVMGLVFGTKSLRIRLYGTAALLLGGLGLLFTLSRSGWLALAAALAVYFALYNRRALLGLAAAGIWCLGLLPEAAWRRFLSIFESNDSSLYARDVIFRVMRPVAGDFWLTGAGLGTDTVQWLAGGYIMTAWGAQPPPHLHNTYLQILVESGIIGLLLFLGVLFCAARGCILCLPTAEREVRAVLSAFPAALTGFLVVSTQEHVLFYPRTLFLFFILLGLAFAAPGTLLNAIEIEFSRSPADLYKGGSA